MEEIKIKGIVIKAQDYQDSDKLVTIFSAERGLLTAKARGVKKPKAKLAFACQPFAFIEFVLFKQGDFYSIKTASSIDQNFSLTLDFDNYVLMMSVLELISKTMLAGEPEPDMFLLLLSCFEAINYGGASAMVVFIKFMIEALKILGFSLNFDRCAICAEPLDAPFGFSFDHGGMLCKKCQRKHDFLELSSGEFETIKRINNKDIKELSDLKDFDRENLVLVIGLMVKVFRIFVDEDIETIRQFL